MSPSLSKEQPAPESEDARRKRLVKIINVSVFMSVCQHVITLQSEPMLVRELCNGSVSQAVRLLANTQGAVGLLGLFLNQAGGKLSDAIGRKPGLMLAPLGNLFIGQLVFNNPTNKLLVLACRIARMALTTFSNTVICTAALTDVCSGKDLALAMSLVGASTGLGVIITPIIETFVLQRTKSPRYSYLALSCLALIQLCYNLILTPETLEAARRISVSAALSMRNLNPFGFMNIFTSGSKALQKIVAVTTMQMTLEGKNLSDIVEIWKREHLKWSVAGSRNFVVIYGTLCVMSGVSLTPYLLRTLTPRRFTSFTNWMNALGFLLRGITENPWVFLLATVPMLPGVNGASASALKALSSDLASAEGFGKGEFSAWVNNLRAVAGSVAPFIYGNYYAWARRRGVPPGSVFFVAAAMGAVLPELLLRLVRDEELRPAKAASQSVPQVAGSRSTQRTSS